MLPSRMNGLVQALARFPVDRPGTTLLAFVLLCAVVFYPLPSFSLAQEDVDDLDPNDPEIVALEEFNRRFGDDEVLLVALESPDAFSEASLSHLAAITDRAAKHPAVERVYSLFTVEDIDATGGEMRTERFLAEPPRTAEERAAKKAKALSNTMWSGFLLSADGTLATLSAVLRKEGGAVPDRAKSAQEILALAEKDAPPGVTVHIAGRGALFLEADSAGKKDLLRYALVTPLWIAGILFYVFRSLRGIAISLFTCAAAVAITVVLFLRSGNPAGMMFTMLPTQVAVICLSDIIHVLARGQEADMHGASKRDALVRTMEHMIPACFYTMATSAIGFLSFNAAGLKSLNVLGTWAAIGIVIAWALAMTLVPALMRVLPARKAATAHFAPVVSGALVELSVRCVRLEKSGRRRLAIGWVAVLVFAALGLVRLNVDSDITSYLPEDSRTVRAAKVLEKKLAGTSSLEIVVEGPKYAFEEPYAIEALEKIEAHLAADPLIDKTFSVLDFLRRLQQARDPSAAKLDVPHDGAALTEAFFVLQSSAEVDRFVTRDRDAVRISARLNAHSTQGPVEIVRAIEEFGKTLDPRLTLKTTGVSKIFAATSHALVSGQAKSLFYSLLWVSLALLVAVRSIRIGVIALFPNVAPIVVTLGVMGWLGIPLDLFTILIGSIALGIAVDDTIHLIARHKEETAIDPLHPDEALVRTLRSSGHPAIFTTFLFAGGFAVFLLSSFPPMRAFGALAAFAMIVAMFADLTLLPLLLRFGRYPGVPPATAKSPAETP